MQKNKIIIIIISSNKNINDYSNNNDLKDVQKLKEKYKTKKAK